MGAVRQSQLSEVEKTSPRNYHRREHTMVSAFVGTVLLLSGHLFQSGWFFTLCLRLRYCYMNPDEENAACEAPEEVHSLWKLRCPRVAWSNLLQCSSYRFNNVYQEHHAPYMGQHLHSSDWQVCQNVKQPWHPGSSKQHVCLRTHATTGLQG